MSERIDLREKQLQYAPVIRAHIA